MRSRADYIDKLRQQIKWLSRSAAEYDRGDVDEALRLSVPLRVLFHDTNQSTSLLTHLGVKTGIRLVSTANPVSPNAGYWAGITDIRIWPQIEDASFIPKLRTAQRKRPVHVDDWWDREVVYLAKDKGLRVTRRSLVLSAANKDGGAHVDEALDPKYQWVADGTGWSITLNPDNGPSKTILFKNAHLAALRQVAYEVITSPDILKLLT